jgi:hypothetical protein
LEPVYDKFEVIRPWLKFDAYVLLKNKKLFPILKLSIAYLLNAIYIARYSKYVHWNMGSSL